MALGTSTHHAAEVTRVGGFGFVGAAFTSPEELREDLALLRKSFPDLGDRPLPIGVGLIGWMLDANEELAKQKIDALLEANVQAFWLAFGNDLHRWIQYARTSPANTRSPYKPLIFVQVTSVEEALRAANEWKADVIVAQGTEAGGHGGAFTPSTFTFVSEVLAALSGDSAPPVLAAGGIANGTQVAAYLTLGAAGAVLGTRFLLTPECPWPEAHKAALLAAKSGSTIRTLAMDYALNLYGWPEGGPGHLHQRCPGPPEGLNGRAIRNKIHDDVEAGLSHATVRGRFALANREGDVGYQVIWSGQGVTLMHEIKPVKDVMAELHTDIVRQLERSNQLLQD
ncbi:2-nitropropane dioxygenase [Earliella scabrosa]|nr:2-nitropropane dioxygenase [Earliella scabrosa]